MDDAGIVITLAPASDAASSRTATFYSIRTASEFLARERWRDWTVDMHDAAHRAVLRPEKAPLEVVERQLWKWWLRAKCGAC
jgi:hypothetical protein